MQNEIVNEYISSIIIEKPEFKIFKIGRNKYSLLFNIENNNIYLPKIVNFTLASLIYELNKDIFEDFKMEMNENKNEATIYTLFKHFLKDFGFPKRYSLLKLQMQQNENSIIFNASTIYEEPSDLPSKLNILPVENMTMKCNIITPHHISFRSDVSFDTQFDIPIMFEKLASTLFSKIFIRIKQFIEKIV